MEEKSCCCCHSTPKEEAPVSSGCCCDMGASAIHKLDDKPVPEKFREADSLLISSGAETFSMPENHRLTKAAEGHWNLFKEIVDTTLASGWNNQTHPWSPALQDFWRYPLAFASYGIPSLIMIDPSRYDEAVSYLKKAIVLMKDTPIWDEWTRLGFGPDPVSRANIMYKGHLNLLYGLYQLVSGSTEFEQSYKELTGFITDEYEYNVRELGYYGIECEPDQWFPQCNSMGMMSMRVRDAIYGTDFDEKYAKPIAKFIYDRVSDPETGLLFAKYHPSHDQAEAYLTGFCNSWSLTMMHIYNPSLYERAFGIYKKGFVKEIMDGKAAYLKEYSYSEEPSTGVEESMGVFYAPGLSKEYGDIDLWEKVNRYFTSIYGIELKDGTVRFTKATPEDETFVSSYLFWGTVHQGWDKVLNYDWAGLRARLGKE